MRLNAQHARSCRWQRHGVLVEPRPTGRLTGGGFAATTWGIEAPRFHQH
jgi:hypothetical protein